MFGGSLGEAKQEEEGSVCLKHLQLLLSLSPSGREKLVNENVYILELSEEREK